MAMSDCVKCWDTPCTCGFNYRNLSKTARIQLASVVLGIPEELLDEVDIPEDHPSQGELR